MSNNLKRLISLIPIQNDDRFYDIYHRNNNSSMKKKVNSILQKPLNLEINNFKPDNDYELDYTLEKLKKRFNYLPKIPKVSINFKNQRLPPIMTSEPTSNNSFIYHKPIEDEKSKVRARIGHNKRQLTINNIIFKDDVVKNNNISKSSSKQNIIILGGKNNINDLQKNSIKKEYEKNLNQFKVYSKNMNEMIANQMVLEFFKKKKESQVLKSGDLMINYIQSNDNIRNYAKRCNTSYNTSINVQDKDNEEINQKNEPNLVIHNVFFEWIIANVIKRNLEGINPLNKNASIKYIRNMLINEVMTLSQIFFYKENKKEEKDLPRNMRIVRNLFGNYKLKRNNSESENKRKKDDIDIQICWCRENPGG